MIKNFITLNFGMGSKFFAKYGFDGIYYDYKLLSEYTFDKNLLLNPKEKDLLDKFSNSINN